MPGVRSQRFAPVAKLSLADAAGAGCPRPFGHTPGQACVSSDVSQSDFVSDFEHDLASQPHDAFARSVLSDPAHARAFFESHLPREIVSVLDWGTLAPAPASFVKQSLQQSHTDLLYSVRAGDREVLLYLLFEHQTTVDATMPLRLLSYITQVLRQHVETRGLPLPPVLPFVLHQGPDRWTVSTAFLDLFSLPVELEGLLRPYLPSFRHELLDLTQFDPVKSEGDPRLQVILALMKAAREKRVMDFFEWLGRAEPSVTMVLYEDLFRRCLLYAVHIDVSLDAEGIARHLSSSPELRDQAMTLAQKLRNEGRNEGRAEGRVEGRVEGRDWGAWIGKIQLLEQLLGLPVTDVSAFEGQEKAQMEARFSDLERQYNSRFK